MPEIKNGSGDAEKWERCAVFACELYPNKA
jgi:hypothetical protein